jgi:DNA-binding transcriptional ArsR family regulator
MERVFKALSDSTRRRILDRLFDTDSLSLGELCGGLEMSRQAVSKHLGILEVAGLVIAVRRGREKRHFLNPVPIQEIGDRWIAKYARKQTRAIAALKGALEEDSHEES